MTSTEPMPGSAQAPYISAAVDRLYGRLPQVYRTMDATQGWVFKRWIAGAMGGLAELDDMIDEISGSRAVGPASPEPWDLEPDELRRWRAARRDVNSSLTDPDLARPEWLPYLAQLLGASLDPLSGLQERRDTLRFATSGFRGGTRMAIADAARSALTGSRYVQIQPGLRADGSAGSLWDITLRSRASETPHPEQVLPTVIRKGAKPAGVVLHHATFGTPWDKIEALFPTWDDWERQTWGRLEESGADYAVPENMAPGPSFETTADIGRWTPRAEGGGAAPEWTLQPSAGIDGASAGRLTKVGASGGMRLRSAVVAEQWVLQGREFIFAVSARPSVEVPLSLVINWQDSGGAAISSTTVAVGALDAGQWNRGATTTQHTSPAGAARATLDVVVTGTVAEGATVDLDAALFRLITTVGG